MNLSEHFIVYVIYSNIKILTEFTLFVNVITFQQIDKYILNIIILNTNVISSGIINKRENNYLLNEETRR